MDRELVERAQQGDEEAFEALTVANHHRLFKVANGILRDAHLAEDATQQAFLDIWQDIRRLRDPARFEGWSYRLLVRVCYAESKRRRSQMPDPEMQPSGHPTADDASGLVTDRDQLERGFQSLSVDHRAVIVLRYLMDMTPEQIAETLSIPTRTVYSRLKRAMPAMRAALEAHSRPTSPASDRQEVHP